VLARLVIAELRSAIRNEEVQTNHSSESLLAKAEQRLRETATFESQSGIKRVINATGVVLHTNLGRAPLSESAQRAISEQAAGYCTLEYNTASGLRGKRGARVEALLCDLTGAEDALRSEQIAPPLLLILGVMFR
jgi:L-seryl-tRNA(Ser) seleniumtransferase